MSDVLAGDDLSKCHRNKPTKVSDFCSVIDDQVPSATCCSQEPADDSSTATTRTVSSCDDFDESHSQGRTEHEEEDIIVNSNELEDVTLRESNTRDLEANKATDIPEKAANPIEKTSSTSSKSSSKTSASSLDRLKGLLLVIMVLQNSISVLVGRYTRSAVPESELYEVNHLIMVIEVAKFVLSCGLETYSTGGRLWESFRLHVGNQPVDALKISIPAMLYLVQNTLLYVALGNLTAPMFQVTFQAKLVTTAIVSVIMLKRSYSMQQWICLLMLSIGVAIVVLGETSDGGKRVADASTTATADQEGGTEEGDETAMAPQNMLLGLTAVTISCFISALAGVYFEMVLKKPVVQPSENAKQFKPAGKQQQSLPPQPSLWMRNLQLAFFSVVIAAVQASCFLNNQNSSAGTDTDAVEAEDAVAQPKPYFYGFTPIVWVLVALQAGRGLLVAAVIKYADNVLKGLSTGVSVVVSTALSMVLFGTPLSVQFCFGSYLILAAVYFFANPLPVTLLHATGLMVPEDRELSERILPK